MPRNWNSGPGTEWDEGGSGAPYHAKFNRRLAAEKRRAHAEGAAALAARVAAASAVTLPAPAPAPAPVVYRSLSELPETGRFFQVRGHDCDRERFTLWIPAGETETAEEVLSRAVAFFDDSHVSSVEEEDLFPAESAS